MAKPSTRKMKPEIRAIVEWAGKHGWKLRETKDGNGHWVLEHPKDGTVRLPDTPGEFRGFANAKAEIRRKSGLPNDSGPAARYRHTGRKREDGFDMDAAVREARLRRAEEEAAARQRFLRIADLSEQLAAAKAELAMINPRRDPVRAREAAVKVLAIQRQLNTA
jgi:hypothetical protein